jgi:hypothetical protein
LEGAVLALDSWRSFSREAILLGRDSKASSYSVRESRIESLAMMESMSRPDRVLCRGTTQGSREGRRDNLLP